MRTSITDTVVRSKRPDVTISAEDAANGRITLSKTNKNGVLTEMTFNLNEFDDLMERGSQVASVVAAVTNS